MLCNLPNRTQIENSRARIQVQAAWLWGSPSHHHTLMLLISKGIDKKWDCLAVRHEMNGHSTISKFTLRSKAPVSQLRTKKLWQLSTAFLPAVSLDLVWMVISVIPFNPSILSAWQPWIPSWHHALPADGIKRTVMPTWVWVHHSILHDCWGHLAELNPPSLSRYWVLPLSPSTNFLVYLPISVLWD
jgi:hypothetical protein